MLPREPGLDAVMTPAVDPAWIEWVMRLARDMHAPSVFNGHQFIVRAVDELHRRAADPSEPCQIVEGHPVCEAAKPGAEGSCTTRQPTN